MKTYKRKLKRKLSGMNSEQRLIVTNDNKFFRIENISLGAHETCGFCPNEFEVGQPVPRGFYAKYGFKKYNPSYLEEEEFQNYKEGDFTGNFI
jgi:hypothetical protein